VIKREFLTNPRLTLYLPSSWEQPFRRPRYCLLLGRTQDVACLESIEPAQLQPVDEGMLSGVLLPWEAIQNQQGRVHAWLQSLPIAFSDEVPRRPLGKHIFGVLDAHQRPSQVNAPDWLADDPVTEPYRACVPLGVDTKCPATNLWLNRLAQTRYC
jgi:CRISPR-associated protein Cas5t